MKGYDKLVGADIIQLYLHAPARDAQVEPARHPQGVDPRNPDTILREQTLRQLIRAQVFTYAKICLGTGASSTLKTASCQVMGGPSKTFSPWIR